MGNFASKDIIGIKQKKKKKKGLGKVVGLDQYARSQQDIP